MNRENDQIRALRESYERGTLDVKDVAEDPIVQFKKWFDSAMDANIFEVNAMTLATVNHEGQPSARTVLLKEIDDKGFVFYTNYESRKGHDISHNKKVSLLFFWKELEQQVRIEGLVEKVPAEVSADYFQSRPKGSQIGAWASPQSQRITRDQLEDRVTLITEEYKNDDVLPLPPHWGGYVVIPDFIEFWQGRQNRLHDRIVYQRKANGQWDIYRVAP